MWERQAIASLGEGRGCEPQNAGSLESWNNRKQIVFYGLQKGMQPSDSLTLIETHFSPFISRPVINVCCFRPLNLGQFITAVTDN
jgi:hypothetical protein